MKMPPCAAVAVRVRYLGPTNYRPSRFSAQVMSGSMSDRNGFPLVASYHHGNLPPHQQAYVLAQAAFRKWAGHDFDTEAISYGHTSPSDYMFHF